jgi:hypothetical protein
VSIFHELPLSEYRVISELMCKRFKYALSVVYR